MLFSTADKPHSQRINLSDSRLLCASTDVETSTSISRAFASCSALSLWMVSSCEAVVAKFNPVLILLVETIGLTSGIGHGRSHASSPEKSKAVCSRFTCFITSPNCAASDCAFLMSLSFVAFFCPLPSGSPSEARMRSRSTILALTSAKLCWKQARKRSKTHGSLSPFKTTTSDRRLCRDALDCVFPFRPRRFRLFTFHALTSSILRFRKSLDIVVPRLAHDDILVVENRLLLLFVPAVSAAAACFGTPKDSSVSWSSLSSSA
mmetsp:Transcript_37239/g.88969  ORF Transcript_37239/g.88969 Transcript_37239/m.88969 type:complete len:263 (-) Transcript_37239:442-1230(-)